MKKMLIGSFGRICCLFAVLSVMTEAEAAQVKGLFEAEIPVTGRGSEERTVAIRAAFEEVLIKVTGYSAVMDEPALHGVLDKAGAHVQQYRYTTSAALPSGQGGGKPARQQKLWVRFGEEGVYRLLKEARLPIWGEARPDVLVWLAVEEEGRRRLVGASDPVPAVDLILNRARQRGVPLLLPLMDLQDRSAVTAADVWGGFHDTLLGASQRYQPQAVLVGRLYAERDGWHAHWVLHLGEQPAQWEARGAELEPVIGAGVDGTAESLSMRFAHVYDEMGQSTLDIRVSAIGDLRAYRRVVGYLSGLNGVTGVQLREVQAGEAAWRLILAVRPESLTQTIGLGSTLVPVKADAGVALQPAELLYRLSP